MGLKQAHRGFLRAFHSITNTSDPKYDIAAAWTTKTGVAVEEVTSYVLLLANHYAVFLFAYPLLIFHAKGGATQQLE